VLVAHNVLVTHHTDKKPISIVQSSEDVIFVTLKNTLETSGKDGEIHSKKGDSRKTTLETKK
jgi:hypothetical protein